MNLLTQLFLPSLSDYVKLAACGSLTFLYCFHLLFFYFFYLAFIFGPHFNHSFTDFFFFLHHTPLAFLFILLANTQSKDSISLHLTEAEDIKKQWQEYTEELYKKHLHNPDNQDVVITHLEPDILEC